MSDQDIVMAIVGVLMVAAVSWAIVIELAEWLDRRKEMRERVTIVRGLHQQDEDLAFPREFAQQVADADNRPKPQICDFSIMGSAVMNGAGGEANRKAFGEQCDADGMRYIVNESDEDYLLGGIYGFVGDDDQVAEGWCLLENFKGKDKWVERCEHEPTYDQHTYFTTHESPGFSVTVKKQQNTRDKNQ